MLALFLFVLVMFVFDYPNMRAWLKHRAEVRELHADIQAVEQHG